MSSRQGPVRALAVLFDRLERHPGRTIAAVGFVFAAAYAGAFLSGASRGQIVRGDAIQYYAYLRSAVFDRDLDFTNEYAALYASAGPAETNVWLTTRTATGRPPNMMSVGPAILWSPPFVLIAVGASIASALGLADPPTGFSPAFQLTAGLAGVLYATLGAWLSLRVVRQDFAERTALWAALVAWLAGPAVYYSVISPTYSHATSLFAVSLGVLAWRRSVGRDDARRWVGLGLLGGLAALVRWQDAIVLTLPAWEVVSRRVARATSTAAVVRAIALMTLGLAIGVLPQLAAWQAIYGIPFVVPQGGSFMRWTEPAIASVLFSPRHGLFLWTPALLVAVPGLVWLARRNRLVGVAALLMLAAAIYVNAAASDWWAGEAFGSRRFIACTPIFALGLAALGGRLEAAGRLMTLRLAAVGLVVYNLLFLLQYQLFMRGHTDLVPYPETLKQILLDRLLLPFSLLGAALGG
jgi:hypothetical protein